MRKKYLILLTVLSVFTLTSCLKSLICIEGNGIEATKVRRAVSFNKIESTTSIDVIYKKADTIGIKIEADENLIDEIISETDNNTLEIRTRNPGTCLDFNTKALITVTSPDLQSIFVSGSGTFIADEMSGRSGSVKLSGSGDISVNKITATDLTVTLSGSGNINIGSSVSANSDVFLSGSGSIGLTGQSENAHLKISGSGKINGENWMLGIADIFISGSGDVYASVEESLTALISGSGNIYLKGDPIITKTISGSGKIIKYK
jgi:hypothetical protein